MSRDCSPNISECPPGHQVRQCSRGFYCQQCDRRTFQPNPNRYPEKCRLKRVCNKLYMRYKKTSNGFQYGSTTEDAVCVCKRGYSFQAKDQRACVPNQICPKGFGVNQFGLCEDCFSKSMYSDTHDQYRPCLPVRNCEKDGRCTIKKSNGTNNNDCGQIVEDVNYCDSIGRNQVKGVEEQGSNILMIVGASAGGIVLLGIGLVLLALLFIVCYKRRSKKKKAQPLTEQQLEDIRYRMLERVDNDEKFACTVLNTCFHVIEDRIEKQIWSFAQEIFREHPITGKYEIVVENYKNTQHKVAVNSYLKEWKSWRGNGSIAIHILIDSLKRNKREDIVFEICNRLRPEMGVAQTYSNEEREQGSGKLFYFLTNVFPCLNREGTTMVRQEDRTNKNFRQSDSSYDLHPSSQAPSAPPINDTTQVQYPMVPKNYSVPIQASS